MSTWSPEDVRCMLSLAVGHVSNPEDEIVVDKRGQARCDERFTTKGIRVGVA